VTFLTPMIYSPHLYSVLTDLQNGGLTMVTGGGYTSPPTSSPALGRFDHCAERRKGFDPYFVSHLIEKLTPSAAERQ
jgi:hypothetical protein